MSNFEKMPDNPAELARVRAEQNTNFDFEQSEDDYGLLKELYYAAELCGFIESSYFVHTNRGMIIPKDTNGDKVSYHNFYGLSFEGQLLTYSKVHIGRLVGSNAVRAVCLTFNDVLLLPYFDKVPEDHLLHVPVLAVDSIDQTK